MLRVGSLALASLGRTRNVQETPFAGAAGFSSLALKQIFGVVEVMTLLCSTSLDTLLYLPDMSGQWRP